MFWTRRWCEIFLDHFRARTSFFLLEPLNRSPSSNRPSFLPFPSCVPRLDKKRQTPINRLGPFLSRPVAALPVSFPTPRPFFFALVLGSFATNLSFHLSKRSRSLPGWASCKRRRLLFGQSAFNFFDPYFFACSLWEHPVQRSSLVPEKGLHPPNVFNGAVGTLSSQALHHFRDCGVRCAPSTKQINELGWSLQYLHLFASGEEPSWSLAETFAGGDLFTRRRLLHGRRFTWKRCSRLWRRCSYWQPSCFRGSTPAFPKDGTRLLPRTEIAKEKGFCFILPVPFWLLGRLVLLDGHTLTSKFHHQKHRHAPPFLEKKVVVPQCSEETFPTSISVIAQRFAPWVRLEKLAKEQQHL